MAHASYRRHASTPVTLRRVYQLAGSRRPFSCALARGDTIPPAGSARMAAIDLVTCFGACRRATRPSPRPPCSAPRSTRGGPGCGGLFAELLARAGFGQGDRHHENGDYFWLDYSNWRIIGYFALLRAGLAGPGAVRGLARWPCSHLRCCISCFMPPPFICGAGAGGCWDVWRVDHDPELRGDERGLVLKPARSRPCRGG